MWKAINGYNYMINENGVIYSIKRDKYIKPQINKNGYLTAALSKDGEVKRLPVHRLVALTFLDNNDNKPEVNHKDGNKLNNHFSNLEWVTRKENIRHAIEMGLFKLPKTEKLWERCRKKVAQIDEQGNVIQVFDSETEACKHFGFHKGTVSRYIRGLRKGKNTLKFKYI